MEDLYAGPGLDRERENSLLERHLWMIVTRYSLWHELADLRYGDIVKCKHCDTEARRVNHREFRCRRCWRTFSLTAGTFLHMSKVCSMENLFIGVYLLVYKKEPTNHTIADYMKNWAFAKIKAKADDPLLLKIASWMADKVERERAMS